MFERPPNGFFVRDLILFNHLRRGGYVAKGFVFEPPDLTNSPIADLNEFQEQLCLLLASLHDNQRLQVQYFSDSDYKTELLRYQQETERFENVWTKRSRNERFARYWQAMVERKLRRQRVVFYISRSLENVPRTLTSNAALREYYLTLLDQLEMEFTHVHHLLKEIFASAGTRVLPMTDLDHFKHYKTFLNPSLADRFDLMPPRIFSRNFPFRKIAGTARATARAISASTWTAIIIPSSRSPAGRAPPIPASSNDSPICGCWTTPSRSMLIRCPSPRKSTRRKKNMTAWPAITPAKRKSRCSPSWKRSRRRFTRSCRDRRSRSRHFLSSAFG